MATVNVAYGTATTISLTSDSLASSATAGRESTVVDNSSNLYLDALVTFKIVYPNSAPANHKGIYVFAYAWDGTDYTYPCTGSDAAVTLDDITTTAYQLAQIGFIPAVQNKTLYSRPFSVASAFGGVLPKKWGVAILNYSGQTLSTGNTCRYQGITTTVA